MPKMVVTFGYRSFVMDGDKAMAMLDLLKDAEQYESKYRSKEEGGTTHHIYDTDISSVELKFLPEDAYRMYKLAGKPER